MTAFVIVTAIWMTLSTVFLVLALATHRLPQRSRLSTVFDILISVGVLVWACVLLSKAAQ